MCLVASDDQYRALSVMCLVVSDVFGSISIIIIIKMVKVIIIKYYKLLNGLLLLVKYSAKHNLLLTL